MRELGQESTGSTPPSACASIRRTTSGPSTLGANQVVKFDPDGSIALVLGRKPEAIGVRPLHRPRPPAATPGPGGGARRLRRRGPGPTPGPACRAPASSAPRDVAWDSAGNIYVADGIGNNNRVVKLD